MTGRTPLRIIRVRPRPGRRTAGVMLAGALAIPVVLGRSGIRPNKREGDGATPHGRFRLIRVWWRADRQLRPRTRLTVRRIDPKNRLGESKANSKSKQHFRRMGGENSDHP